MRRHAAGWGPERAVKFTGPGLRPSHPPHSIQIRLLDQRAEISFLELAFPSESLSREEESEVLYESCFLVPSLKSASQTGYFGAPRERTSRRSFAIPGGVLTAPPWHCLCRHPGLPLYSSRLLEPLRSPLSYFPGVGERQFPWLGPKNPVGESQLYFFLVVAVTP